MKIRWIAAALFFLAVSAAIAQTHVPVATVAIGGGVNAGLLAVQILASGDHALQSRVLAYKNELAEMARQQDWELTQSQS